MKLLVRVDASLKIGTGHVMRCLTLAAALKNQGSEVAFICRIHEGNLLERIEQQGFQVYKLPQIIASSDSSKAVEANEKETLYGSGWLGSTQQQDAQQCQPILECIRPDWLIVDHYGIDQTWQALLKERYKKLMVIDDLADRKHLCDLLLDQTYGRKAEDYEGLLPRSCKMLLGSQYALLRPEFAQWRKYSLKRRENPMLKKLLVTMGGSDPDNVTGQVLNALKTCDLPEEIEITVIVGAIAPHLDSVKAQAEVMPYKTLIKVDVNNMAEIMANSDLAIGAMGATTWERCCLGLVSIQVVIAENQKYAASKLSESQAVSIMDSVNELCLKIKKLNFYLMSQKNACLCDGLGVSKVMGFLK